MQSERHERDMLVEMGRRLWQRGFVAANDGNLSARLNDGSILVTPTGMSKGFLDASDLVLVSAEGERLKGEGVATTELGMHLAVYRARQDVCAVVHAHPPRATAFAASGTPLDADFLPEAVLALGKVPTAPYGTPSTMELVQAIEPFLPDHNALLLQNHGAVTFGHTIREAYFRMETLEHTARIALEARRLGGPEPLSADRIAQLRTLSEYEG